MEKPLLGKLTITYKVATDKNIFSTTLWRDELETDFFETWDVEILEGGEIWQQLDYGINNSRALHANEAKDTTDFAVYMLNPAEAVLLGNEPSIYFYHQYNTQNTLDGGYLMVSEDGQIWERLSDSDWSLNGPNSDLSYSTFVVPNLRGFSGNSNGFIPSVANLSKWAGKKVYFKFRFGTYDNLVSTQPGRLGWTLDNLEIINPIYYNTTACVTSGLGDNICLASKGKGTLIESNKIVSVTPKDKEIKFNVFPNPAKAIAYVNLFNGEQFEVMNIVDATGKNIYSTVLNQSNQQQIKINTSQFSKGIYFVEIKGKQESRKQKLVIQ